MLPKSWKKTFTNGIIIPVKMRRRDECNDKILCITCNNRINENKELEAYLNLLKRQGPNQFRHMLPHQKELDVFICNKTPYLFS